MSSSGELYIHHCRDYFDEELNKVFGKGKYHLDVGPFYDCWDMRTFPEKADVDVLNDDDIKIGVATIKSVPRVEDDGYGRYVDMAPKTIKIKKINTKIFK